MLRTYPAEIPILNPKDDFMYPLITESSCPQHSELRVPSSELRTAFMYPFFANLIPAPPIPSSALRVSSSRRAFMYPRVTKTVPYANNPQ